MTEQEIADLELLYSNMPHLLDDLAGEEHFIKIGVTPDPNPRDREGLFVFPQAYLYELMQLGLVAFKAKHGDPEPSKFWAEVNAAFEDVKQGKATMQRVSENKIIIRSKKKPPLPTRHKGR